MGMGKDMKMQIQEYTTGSLVRSIEDLERNYGMSSADFVERYRNDDPSLSGIPGFTQHMWISIYDELVADDDGGFSASLTTTLAHA